MSTNAATPDWLHAASGPWQAPTLLLAALLALMALLALALLWHIREQRRKLHRARHYLAVEQDLRGVSSQVSLAVFMLRTTPGDVPGFVPLVGDLSTVAGLQATLPPGENPLLAPAFREHVHPGDLPSLSQLLELPQQTGREPQARATDFRMHAPEGMRWLHISLAPQALAGGGAQWIGCLFDTSRTRAHSEALRAARDAAERAAKARADFLATMSHEIRTPMNGVIGMLELLGQTPLDAAQGELLHAVEDSAGVLLQILNDVLDFSKLEAGSLRLDREPFDPRILLDNVVGMMAPAMRRKGLRVDVTVDATTAGLLLGDGVRIRQILLNLLGNAAKFTEHGRIAVAWRVLGEDDDTQRLRISVSDTGIGIPEEKQAALFTPFNQAEDWTSRRYGGTGLGLAICRHLVQLMDGEITLGSRPGEGTTVALQLRLPIARREPERPPAIASRHAVVRLREAAPAATLAEHLAALGLTVERVEPALPLRDGMAADLLFLDEDDHDSGQAIPARVVALTLHDDPAPALAADERILLGANPLRWQALLRACTLALAPRRATASTPAATPATGRTADMQRRRTQRILVAEDHPVSRQLMQRQLEQLGWPCELVDNGRDALAALQRGGYALLLTDCNMPQMSGYELAAAWRRHERESATPLRLPIIATTANALAGELARCREAGMDDCLSKPLQLQPLEHKLGQWLDHAGDAASSAAPAMPPDDAGAWRRQLLPLLVTTTRTDLDELSAAVGRGDTETAAQRLHRILGVLPLVTDDPLLEHGRRRMERLRSGETAVLADLPPYLGELHQLLERL
ncbi:ATP-binding protein [Rhodanobacter sp. DHB23]|uniref:ATP-binding protein n=1 Tax=Rhodanobacter sp. DHB23 TaxID=2775923 RepID=UPI00177F4AE4|nr:ATP-binding protein [Rhodanobacter sp. DHB23]MBD8871682.1 response regulator [Rhodanobacter sp. DHB23]